MEMNMRNLFLISLATMLFLQIANAEMLSLKDITPGVTRFDEIETRVSDGEFRKNCEFEYEPISDEAQCFIGPITLANKKVYAFSVVYRGNLVVSINTLTTDEDVPHIAAALEAKFGPPTIVDLIKENAYGAETRGKKYVWNDGERLLSFESIGSKKTEGRISLVHQESLKAMQLLLDEAAKSSIDDL